MLRVLLGAGGVSLIALGVFGGQALDSMHRGVSGMFTPDTVVVDGGVESVSPVVQAVAQSVVKDNNASTTVALAKNPDGKKEPENLIVLASSESQSGQLPKTDSIATETVLKISSANSDTNESQLTAAAVTEDTAVTDTLATASKAVVKSPVLPAADVLKADGVEVVVTSTTGVPPNDTLFVLKERVNMREGPSTVHPIVLQLDVGQELMEFKRDGKWVHVGAYGTAGKIGWVHATLVGSK